MFFPPSHSIQLLIWCLTARVSHSIINLLYVACHHFPFLIKKKQNLKRNEIFYRDCLYELYASMDRLQVDFVVLILNQLMLIKNLFQMNLDLLNDLLKMEEEEEMLMNQLEQLMMMEEVDSLINHKDRDSLDELNLSYPIEKDHLKELIHHFVDYNLQLNHYDKDMHKN